MTKRIFFSIFSVAVSVFFASIVLIMGVLYDYFSKIQQKQLRIQVELAAQGVTNEGAAYFSDLAAGIYRITWIDADGRVLYDTGSDAASMESHIDRKEIREALEKGYGESTRYSNTLTERLIYIAKRLPDGTVLRLAGTQFTVWALLLGIFQAVLIVAVIAIILSMVLALRLSKAIVKPLNELNLEDSLNNKGYPELQPLLDTEKQKAEELRREFTANVSHELKTPLHAISGYAELLKNGMVKAEDTAGFSERIYSEAQRMIALVEDIIHLSRLDEGAQELQREEVDLYVLAQNVVQSLQPMAQAARINLSLCGRSAVFIGVEQLLSGILFNLCDNAIKYNRPDGSASVEVIDKEKEVILVVSDTGIGIPQEHQERVFERFYRVDKSHSKKVGGTGLGLSIVKHAARLHQADIELYSILGGGTTVKVCFPKL